MNNILKKEEKAEYLSILGGALHTLSDIKNIDEELVNQIRTVVEYITEVDDIPKERLSEIKKFVKTVSSLESKIKE